MSTKNNFMQAVQELFGVEVVEERDENERKEEYYAAEAEESKEVKNVPEFPAPGNDDGEVSVLGRGLTITGQVNATGNVELHGTLYGDLEVAGDVKVFGEITGNVRGKNVLLNAAQVRGNIMADQNIALDDKSVVIGDLNAGSLALAGSVKGNIKVRSTAEFEQAAILLGDIECTGISVKEGAEICGRISMQSNRTIKAFEEDFADRIAGNI